MNINKIINWSEVSRELTGDRGSIRATYKGKAHKAKVDKIKIFFENWLEPVKEQEEIIKHRKEEAKSLQNALLVKLSEVQKLAIKRVLKGESVVFEINSFANSAMLHGINGINCGHEYYQAHLKHYAQMDFNYSNVVCEYYKEQHKVVDYWIKILK